MDMSAFSLTKKLVLLNKNLGDQGIITQPEPQIPPISLFQKTKDIVAQRSEQMATEKLKLKLKSEYEEPKKVEIKKIDLIKKVDTPIETQTEGKKYQIRIKIKPQTQKSIADDFQKMDMWAEKYRPRKLDNLVGNSEQIATIRDWFDRFKEKDNTIRKALLFSGCPGTSKTTVAHVILHEFGYDVKEYNASDVRSKKLVEENLDKLITMEQVDKHFRDNFKPFGIIMDEVDGMSSGDKGGMTQLIKTINPNRGKRCVKKIDKQKINDRWIPPIICICNNNYDKKINELKKDCLEIKFDKPTIDDLCLVIHHVTKNEHMQLTKPAEKLIAELAQGDFRRLMFLLQNFSNIRKVTIDVNDIYEYYDIITKKILDLNSFDVTNKIFLRQTGVEDILKLYDTDKSLLPMMIHENYINVINSQNTELTHKMMNCHSCIDSIVNGDIIEKVMYNTQSWYLQPIHGLCSCYIPSYYANIYPKLNHSGFKWTTALGRFSLQRATIKNINLIASVLNTGHSYTVDDIQLLSQLILYNLLDSKGNPQIGAEYMKNYNLTMKDIKKLIKVDKLSDKYKKLYTAKQKTVLTRLFGNLTQREIYSMTYNVGKNSSRNASLCAEATKQDVIDVGLGIGVPVGPNEGIADGDEDAENDDEK